MKAKNFRAENYDFTSLQYHDIQRHKNILQFSTVNLVANVYEIRVQLLIPVIIPT